VHPVVIYSIILEQVVLVEYKHPTGLLGTSQLEIRDGCYYQVYVIADNYSELKKEDCCSLSRCRIVSEVFLKDFPLFISFYMSPRFEKILKGEIPYEPR
jgi:hypothetical protein